MATALSVHYIDTNNKKQGQIGMMCANWQTIRLLPESFLPVLSLPPLPLGEGWGEGLNR